MKERFPRQTGGKSGRTPAGTAVHGRAKLRAADFLVSAREKKTPEIPECGLEEAVQGADGEMVMILEKMKNRAKRTGIRRRGRDGARLEMGRLPGVDEERGRGSPRQALGEKSGPAGAGPQSTAREDFAPGPPYCLAPRLVQRSMDGDGERTISFVPDGTRPVCLNDPPFETVGYSRPSLWDFSGKGRDSRDGARRRREWDEAVGGLVGTPKMPESG